MTANNSHAQVLAADSHEPKVHATTHEDGGTDELEITSLATSETDDTLVLAPDGVGGVEFRAEAGGGSSAFVGCKVYHAGTENATAGSSLVPSFNSEEVDTDNFHFTSAAALTGTVAKTASSANIVGTGTSFTTELSVNQVISIPGTATEIGVVKTITDDTNLVLWQTMANTASGQTATRKSSHFAIPAGKGGKYRAGYATFINGYSGTAQTTLSWRVNDAFPRGGERHQAVPAGASYNLASASPIFILAEGDFLYPVITNGSSATQTFGHASALNQQTTFMLEYLGA